MASGRAASIVLAVVLALLVTGWPPGALGDPSDSPTTGASTTGSPPSDGNSTTDSSGNSTADENGTSSAPSKSTGARYDFDHVEATYAASFQVKARDVGAGNWALAMAGANATLNVTYGEVRFSAITAELSPVYTEKFLKVEGSNGTRRFLGNSASNTFYDDGGPETAGMEFSSHKRIDNHSLVKDFTPPIFSVHLWRGFDESGNRTFLLLSTWEGWEAQDEFWRGVSTQNVWDEVPRTFLEAGDPLEGEAP